MKPSYHTVRLNVRIFDQAAFFASAVARAIADGMSEADARESLSEEPDDDATDLDENGRVPNLNACLQMLFDPGVSPDGCEIQESSAEHDYDGEDSDATL